MREGTRTRALSWPAAAGLLLGACGGADSAAPADGAVTVSADAVQALPALDDVTRVVDLQPTGDGRVWVLNSIAPFFLVLAPDGRVEHQFGDRGGGPQEFGRPVALVRGASPDEVWVYDWARNALIDISSAERRELALPGDSIPIPALVSFKGAGINAAPPWLERARDGFVLARARTTREESALHLWNADVMLIRDGAPEPSVDVHTPVADHLGDPATRYGAANVLIPYPLWSVCPDGSLALYDPLANALRRFREAGAELDSLALPAERAVPMSADVVFEMFYRQIAEDVPAGNLPPKEAIRQQTEAQNEQFVAGSSPAFPEYSDLRCAPDGALWLRRFDPSNGRLGQGSDWLRVSPDGARTSVALPPAFRTFRIERDRIWGAVRDSLGVESVAWVGLEAVR